ncbi:MAG TPA: GAF domain-containing protein [Candidatus Angelobacter sp.]|nr:GAF domain-containing protein [Candidatus Angelobacter sp.]
MAIQPTVSLQDERDLTPLTGELTMIAQRAQTFTGASGSAIAMMDEVIGQIRCCARSGFSAPDIGVPVKLENTLTGLCILNGTEQRCDDTENDPRVDNFSVRVLNLRSILVVPVKDQGAVIGVLAVFSPTPYVFTVTHLAVLKTMADQIARLVRGHRQNKIQEAGLHPVRVPVSLCS